MEVKYFTPESLLIYLSGYDTGNAWYKIFLSLITLLFPVQIYITKLQQIGNMKQFDKVFIISMIFIQFVCGEDNFRVISTKPKNSVLRVTEGDSITLGCKVVKRLRIILEA